MIWMVRWRTAYWWVVCCVVLWVGDAHPVRDRRFESIGALLGVWGSTGVCVLVGPLLVSRRR